MSAVKLVDHVSLKLNMCILCDLSNDEVSYVILISSVCYMCNHYFRGYPPLT